MWWPIFILFLVPILWAQDSLKQDSSKTLSLVEPLDTVGSDRIESDFSPPHQKKVHFAGIPIISYNRSFGMLFGAMGNMVYTMNLKDTISPPSTIGIWGSYYTNNTFFLGTLAKNYFKEDQWRSSLFIAYGNIEFQTFVDMPMPAEAPQTILANQDTLDTIIDYTTTFFLFNVSGLRQIRGAFYLGVQSTFQRTTTDFHHPEIEGSYEKNILFGFGLHGEYDTRDFSFNPLSGANAKVRTMSYLEALGSSTQYHRIGFEYNKYFQITPQIVVLARFNSVLSVGNVPFSGQNIVGRDDLRGYSQGEYRGEQLYDIQSAFRWTFYKRLGLVVFGGVALTTDDWYGNNYSGILPAGGFGFRFMMLKKQRMNAGIDIAWGKDDWGLYFRLGEAFAR